MAREWSRQQSAVFEAVGSGEGHLVVEARAGTGKTTTAIEALYATVEGTRTIFVAFNKAIAQELGQRVPQDVEAKTLHSFGLQQITRCDGRREIDGYAFSKRLKAAGVESRKINRALCSAVARAKSSITALPELGALSERLERIEVATDCGLLDAISREHPSDPPHAWAHYYNIAIGQAARCLIECAHDDRGVIDFDDMVWLPVVRGIVAGRHDFVFVDETQDLSPVQLALVQQMIAPDGRIVAIGDRYQAIYGFRGADSGAIPNMISTLGAEVLPLTVTYRCPKSVVALAKAYVPDLEANESNGEGLVGSASKEELIDQAGPGDFVISRTNAPLLSLCFGWVAEGTAATIRGRQIGEGLAKWIEGTRSTSIPQLMSCVESWLQAETARRIELDLPLEEAQDKAACLRALATNADSPGAAAAKARRLFSDDASGSAIQLMSAHRSKGLEAERIWALDNTFMRSRDGKRVSQEEKNLFYVAITRSQNELYRVGGVG